MTAMGLFYPSPSLASAIDPLELARANGRAVNVEMLQSQAVDALSGALPKGDDSAAADATWFWAGIAMLDGGHDGLDRWISRTWPRQLVDYRGSGFGKHCEMFAAARAGQLRLGRPPKSLAQTLAAYALGSPAVCALRALRRVAPELPWDSVHLLNAAAQVAWAFRTLFNLHETAMMLRGEDDRAYWRVVLDYCVRGNLQAVLDEYVHVLQEQLGLLDVPAEGRVSGIAEAIADALSIRTARIGFDAFEVQDDRVETHRASVRTRFALRYGDLRNDDQTLNRTTTVRAAFNSPFRPFVLISTSVGQEGLDFHTYCHRVWHWNLPHNPVDLEQREGRVHRYKGHAIRRAVAARYSLDSLNADDPWAALFHRAESNEAGHALHPFWLYETDSGPKIERCVPTLPMSRETRQLDDLKRSLAVYRLALGQARQDDLLAFLRRHGAEYSDEDLDALRISLRPPGNANQHDMVGRNEAD
jgi:hypothetical protein